VRASELTCLFNRLHVLLLYLFGVVFNSKLLLWTCSVLQARPTIKRQLFLHLLLLLVLRMYQLSKIVSSTDLLVLVASKVSIRFIGAAAVLAYAILVA